MTSSQPSWIGRPIGGRYQIESLLGRGGMSSVYKATDPNLQRSVAVKLIHPHLSEHPEFLKRFEQEAAAVAQLRHPNIIQVFDFNHDQDVYYMILEYLPGETLESRLTSLKAENSRIPLADAIRILASLCDAAAYAHERNMVHRDLKPSNVILTPSGQPILMDFGIAKIVGGDHVHTATGATIGTAAYMSPEQVIGEGVDHRADIYSLGIMLYEMAAGRQPFEGKSSLTVMMKHVNEPAPDIRIFNDNAPDVLVGILEKALAKNPDDRFASASEMATALRMTQQPTVPISQPLATPPLATPPLATPSRLSPAPMISGVSSAPLSEPAVETTPGSPVGERGAETAVPPAPSRQKRNPMGVIAAIIGIIGLGLGAYFLLPKFLQSPPTSAGMVNIPAGNYTIGLGSGGNLYAAAQQVELAEFWIDQYEVTNSEYAWFLADTNNPAPANWSDSIRSTQANYPVQGTTWEMARDYCEWADKRLPTEAEWETAVRSPQGWLYPWGNDKTAVQLPTSGTYPVGSLPANRSFFGASDMAGNVWEWVTDPYIPVTEGNQVLRGGANDFQNDMLTRLPGDPNSSSMFGNAGIRCAASQVELETNESVILDDHFADLDSGWWQARTPVDNYFYGYHPTDFYHVQVSAANDCLTINREMPLGDFMAEVEIFIASTDTEDSNLRYGLILREADSAFYAFVISPRTQTWQVLKSTPDGMALMDEGSSETIQGEAQETRDRLFAIALGPEMTFFINGQLTSRVYDSDYTNGNIGFIVKTLDETYAHIHYDSLAVWEMPANMMPPPSPTEAGTYPVSEPLCRGVVSAENVLVNFTSHTVAEGERLNEIAEQYGSTVEEILRANGKSIDDPSVIRVGQTIVIPEE